MFVIFFLVIFFAPALGLYLYKHQGKRQLFHIDLVQFIYLFILIPLILFWGRILLFYLLESEWKISPGNRDYLIVDSIYMILSFYILIAVSFHTLTKSFSLKKLKDPDFDVFKLSEYFHLWWSHLAMYSGAFLMIVFSSVVNLFFPIIFPSLHLSRYLFAIVGILCGILVTLILWTSDPKLENRNFLRAMKLLIALASSAHLTLYFLVQPSFSQEYTLFWLNSFLCISMVFTAYLLPRSKTLQKFFYKLLHPGWGENLYRKL